MLSEVDIILFQFLLFVETVRMLMTNLFSVNLNKNQRRKPDFHLFRWYYYR